MKDRDQIEQLFSNKFENYQAKVNPDLWNNIALKVAGESTSAAVGVSMFTKIIAVSVSIASIVGIVAYSLSTSEKTELINDPESQTDNKVTTVHDEDETTAVFEKESTIQASELSNTIKHTEDLVEEDPTQSTGGFDIIEDDLTNIPPINENDVLPTREIAELVEQPKESTPLKLEEEEVISSQELTIEEGEQEEESIPGYKIDKMPNTFSPNNDGQNDYFFIKSSGLSDFNLVVLDAQNSTVFQSTNPEFKWNGITVSGEQAPNGKYIYFITAVDGNGNPINKYSSLTILR